MDAGGLGVDVLAERVVLDVVRDVESPDAADAEAPTCALAVRATFSIPPEGTGLTGTGDLYGESRVHTSHCASQGVTEGPEDIYAFRLDTRMYVSMGAAWTRHVAQFDSLVVSLRRACDDASTEVACAGAVTEPGQDPTSPAVSAVLEPGEYYAVVDVADYSVGNAYEYRFGAEPLAPGTSTCLDAVALPAGARLTGEPFGNAAAVSVSCLNAGVPLRTRFYRVAVPAGRSLVATTHVQGDGSVSLAVLSDCDTSECESGAAAFSRSAADSVFSWRNDGDVERDVLLAVQSQDVNPSPLPFDLALDVEAAPPGANCASPAAIVDGRTYHDAALLAADAVRGCADNALLGHLLYYAGTIPPGGLLGVDPVGSSDRRLTGFFAGACPLSAACAAAWSVPTEGRYEYNPGPAPRPFLLALSPASGAPDVDFAARLGPAPSNRTCPEASPLELGPEVHGPVIASGAAVDTPCGSLSGAQFFRTSLAPGATLRVAAASESFSPAVALFGGCGAADACLVPPNGLADAAADLVYTNAATSTTDVVLAVAGAPSQAVGVGLTAGITRGAMIETVIAPACDDLSGAPSLPLTRPRPTIWPIDDGASEALPLPFAFPYFGESIGYYTVYSNGLIQLLPGAHGTPLDPMVSHAPSALPSTSAPPRVIAPLWMDLRDGARDGGGATVRAQAFAAAPDAGRERHFTVEWSDWAPYETPDGEITFQAQLFETGAVEFHYCRIVASAASTGAEYGSEASIGLQDSSGTVGVQHSLREPRSVSTSLALRYDPSP